MIDAPMSAVLDGQKSAVVDATVNGFIDIHWRARCASLLAAVDLAEDMLSAMEKSFADAGEADGVAAVHRRRSEIAMLVREAGYKRPGVNE